MKERSPSLGSPGGAFIPCTTGHKGIHALLQDKDAGCGNNDDVMIIFTECMLCARCCVSTLEHYYLIHPHHDHVIDEEMNPGELSGLPPVSGEWQSGDQNLTSQPLCFTGDREGPSVRQSPQWPTYWFPGAPNTGLIIIVVNSPDKSRDFSSPGNRPGHWQHEATIRILNSVL